MALDNICIRKITNKTKESINYSFVSDIYKLTKDTFCINLYNPKNDNLTNSKRNKLVISLDLKNPFFTYTQEEVVKLTSQDQFFIALKKLNKTQLIDIKKIKGERIVTFYFKKDENLNYIDTDPIKNYALVLELFPNHPNLILLNSDDNKIVSIYKEKGELLSDNYLGKNSTYIYSKERKELEECTNLEESSTYLSNKTFQFLKTYINKLEENNVKYNLQELFKTIVETNELYIKEGTIQPFHFSLEKDKIQKLKVEELYNYFLSNQKEIASYLKEESLRKELEKLFKFSNKKLSNLKEDLQRAKQNLINKEFGEYLLNIQYDYDKVPEIIEYNKYNIKLNNFFSFSENANIYFKKYKKSKLAIPILTELIEKTEADILYFKKKIMMFDKSNQNDINQLKEELVYLNYIKTNKKNDRSKSKKKSNKQKVFSPHHINTKFGKIYYGINDLQNETLTFKMSHADDVFIHVKDYPGSHIVIRKEDKNNEQLITIALSLALYLSNLDSSEIYLTSIRHVKKNPLKIGLVNLREYKVVKHSLDQKSKDLIKVLIKQSN